MPIGPYSPCPGGLDKKLKFCCTDLLGEWQKIERWLEGGQHQACLAHVEKLDRAYPGRACLLAVKALLLRTEDRLEEARDCARQLLEKHPDNPLGLAELAIAAAGLESPVAAMAALQRAIAASAGQINERLYDAMTVLSHVLAGEGHVLAARALASAQLLLDREDRQVLGLLRQLTASANIPLVAKEDLHMAEAPEGAPWKPEFDQVKAPLSRLQWAAAAEKLAALAERFPDTPALWHSLAILRAWLADTPRAVEALRRFAAMDVPEEDAIEAETLALWLLGDPFGDQVDLVAVEFPVKDAEQVLTALLSSPRTPAVQVDPASLATEDQPPPKAICVILDRAVPLTAAGLTLESIPKVIGRAILYGRQTDREARLQLQEILAEDLPQVKALMAELADGQLGPPTHEEATGHVPASYAMLLRHWRLPGDARAEQIAQWCNQFEEETLLNHWPRQPLPYLDGKSPEEAAGHPSFRVRLAAAVCLVEFWMERAGVRMEGNRLRSRLGLPTLDPFELGQQPIETVPLARLDRVVVEKLPDEALLVGFRRAFTYHARRALRKFALAVADRPTLAGKEEQRRALGVLAQTEEDTERALAYLDRAREADKAAGQSCADWDLTELSARLQRGEGDAALRLIEHLDRHHRREPGVVAALTNLLVRFGVLRPDGRFAGEPAHEEPAIVVPGQPGAEPGKLWTPDSQTPPGPAGQKPAIWTPDVG